MFLVISLLYFFPYDPNKRPIWGLSLDSINALNWRRGGCVERYIKFRSLAGFSAFDCGGFWVPFLLFDFLLGFMWSDVITAALHVLPTQTPLPPFDVPQLNLTKHLTNLLIFIQTGQILWPYWSSFGWELGPVILMVNVDFNWLKRFVGWGRKTFLGRSLTCIRAVYWRLCQDGWQIEWVEERGFLGWSFTHIWPFY